MKKMVPSALGLISTEDFGITLPHEHVVYSFSGWENDIGFKYDRQAAIDKAVREYTYTRNKYNLQTVFDCTPCDCGRDLDVLKAVQEKTGVNIISSTGLYNSMYGQNNYWNRLLKKGPIATRLYEKMMHELTIGIDDSGVRAGFIKVGTSVGTMTDFEAQLIEAAAMANKESGAPIITHSEHGTLGDKTAEMLVGFGVKPTDIMISHMDLTADHSYVERTLSYGVFISFDNPGIPLPPDPSIRMPLCADIINRGYEKQVMLSNDYICCNKGNWNIDGSPLPPTSKYTLNATFEIMIPFLESKGVSEETIKFMQTQNPRRLFEND